MRIGEAATRRAMVAGMGTIVVAAPLWIVTREALAEDLAEAKRNGFLGERIDGYLGVVSANTPASVRAMAGEINAKRRAEYADIAKRQGVSVEAVGQLAGQKLINRAAAGEWVLGTDGEWRRK
jgi:uncharacterized protein YdbL (DUF1318 family)